MSDKEGVPPRNPWSAALGALCGLRTRADFERDAAGLNIKHVVAAAIVLMAIFVGGIITVVHFVAR